MDKMVNPRIPCPNCGSNVRSYAVKQPSLISRIIYYNCLNDQCLMSFNAVLNANEIVREPLSRLSDLELRASSKLKGRLGKSSPP